MKNIGVTQWCLDYPTGIDSLKRASDLGFSFIHVNADNPGDEFYLGESSVIDKYQNVIDAHKIHISAISLNALERFGLLVDDNNDIDFMLRKIIDTIIASAYILKVPVVYFPSFVNAEITNHDKLRKTIIILQYACDQAEKYALDIATENTLTVEDIHTLFDQVDRKNLKLLVDSQNYILWQRPILTIVDEFYSKMINQVHVKDGINQMGNARLGEGDAKLNHTLACLCQKGYNGLFILENDYSVDAAKKINEDRKNLLSILSSTNKMNLYANV